MTSTLIILVFQLVDGEFYYAYCDEFQIDEFGIMLYSGLNSVEINKRYFLSFKEVYRDESEKCMYSLEANLKSWEALADRIEKSMKGEK